MSKEAYVLPTPYGWGVEQWDGGRRVTPGIMPLLPAWATYEEALHVIEREGIWCCDGWETRAALQRLEPELAMEVWG